MTTENKKPSDGAMRAASRILDNVFTAMSRILDPTATVRVVENIAFHIDEEWNAMAEILVEPLAAAQSKNQEIADALDERERLLDAPAPTIQPGAVVTLASGGEPWTVVKWSKSEEKWLCRKDVRGAGPVEGWFYPHEMSKVKPEPPGMNEETRAALVHAADIVLNSTPIKVTPDEIFDLRRWLDAQRGL